MSPTAVETDTAEEAARLVALRDLMVLDSQAEPLFDSLARLASQVCGVPVALLSLVDAERQWFKANVGLPGVNETPRDVAFCAHAIEGDQLFEVGDASIDPRFASNPLVTGNPDIRFYAGAPLVLPGGARVGTLCVIDRQPRRLTAEQSQRLRELADLATQALVMRRDLIDRALRVRTRYEISVASSEAHYRSIVEQQDELVSLARPDGTLVFVNAAYAAHFGLGVQEMVGLNLYDYVDAADREAVRGRMAEVLASKQKVRSENRMLTADGRELWAAWSNQLQTTASGDVLLLSVGRDVSARRSAEMALRDSQRFLARVGRVGGVGGWELDLQTQALRWTEETRRLHEVPEDYVPDVAKGVAFYDAEARPVIATAVQICIDGGGGWDLELPFTTALGRHLWVRAQGELELENGQPRRLIGTFQDITERRALQQRVAQSERFVRQVTDNVPIRINYIDTERRFRFINALHASRFGRKREDIVGKLRSELTDDGTEQGVSPYITAALAGQPQRFEYDDLVAGERRRIDVRIIPDLDERGQVRGLFGVGIDVTERTQAQHSLQRQTATLQAVTDALPAMVAVVDAQQHVRFVNRGFQAWARQASGRLLGRALADVLAPSVHAPLAPWVARALAGETVSFEAADTGPQGEETPFRHLAVDLIPLRSEDGVADGFLVVAQDVTEHKEETVRLQELTQRDPLTGLLNRRGATEQFRRMLASAGRESLALLALDLDHFKPVNDVHGHAVGDRVLQNFAQRLQGLLRPSDLLARLGGDEFVVLLAGVREPAHARLVADKIIAAAAEPMVIDDLRLQVGASVGLAFGARSGLSAAEAWGELLARADEQLYAAKAAGRGRREG